MSPSTKSCWKRRNRPRLQLKKPRRSGAFRNRWRLYRPVGDVGCRVEPLGEGFISELPDGFAALFAPAAALPALLPVPVVVPVAAPDEVPVAGDPLMVPVVAEPPAL